MISSSKIGKNKLQNKPNGSLSYTKKDLFRYKRFDSNNAIKVYSNSLRQSIDIDNYSDLIKARKLAN